MPGNYGGAPRRIVRSGGGKRGWRGRLREVDNNRAFELSFDKVGGRKRAEAFEVGAVVRDPLLFVAACVGVGRIDPAVGGGEERGG